MPTPKNKTFMTTAYEQVISNDWGRRGLGPAILDALKASGKHLEALTIDDLAPHHRR
jgi:hypothetical protein